MLSHSTERNDVEALVVSPKGAARVLNTGLTNIYALINSKELESYKDGTSRRITMRSIRAYMERKLQAPEPPLPEDHVSRRRQAEAASS